MTKKSGFEPISEPKVCQDPSHKPPSFMEIPQGQQYRHVCRKLRQGSYFEKRSILLGGIMIDLVKTASIFSLAAHAAIGQKRKYTEDCYFVHPKNVARMVLKVKGSEEMVAAALLHDVVEDTKITIAVIANTFGNLVAHYVSELTDISKPEDGNRDARKEIDRQYTSIATPEAKTIKLADLIDNSLTIRRYDPGFAKVYLAEKRLLLDSALKEGNPILWQIADLIVSNDYFQDFGSVIDEIDAQMRTS